MRIQVLRCDRCEAQQSPPDRRSGWMCLDLPVMRGDHRGDIAPETIRVDLCAKCTERLARWLEPAPVPTEATAAEVDPFEHEDL